MLNRQTVKTQRNRMFRNAFRVFLLAASLSVALFSPSSYAERYMTQEAFLDKAFAKVESGATQNTPAYESHKLWVTKAHRKVAETILAHKFSVMRVRYWRHGDKTAWIINEIGKERPITIGVVVNGDAIEFVSILAFRESRGWEVRHGFFTAQFKGLKLTDDHALTAPIDGITGATLSVYAVRNVARLALYFDTLVDKSVDK